LLKLDQMVVLLNAELALVYKAWLNVQMYLIACCSPKQPRWLQQHQQPTTPWLSCVPIPDAMRTMSVMR
jgi:hypothetical protein